MEKCPCCDREFRGVFEYPLIEITHVEELILPDHMKGRLECDHLEPYRKPTLRERLSGNLPPFLPVEVERKFRNFDVAEVPFNGFVYVRNIDGTTVDGHEYRTPSDTTFSQFVDIQPTVGESMKSGKIKEYLDWLESRVGKKIKPTELRENIPHLNKGHLYDRRLELVEFGPEDASDLLSLRLSPNFDLYEHAEELKRYSLATICLAGSLLTQDSLSVSAS